MKLTQKFAFWYLAVTLGVLAMGAVAAYYIIKNEIDQEQARYLRTRIAFIEQELSHGLPPDSLKDQQVEIRILPVDQAEMSMRTGDTVVWHHHHKRRETEIKVAVSRKINGQHFYIATHDAMVESDDITEAVLKSFAGILAILLGFTAVLTMMVSRRLLAPFHRTLDAIQGFRLRHTSGPELPDTRTDEFRKLNAFLRQMTDKARRDYAALKEFTENASHEMQTPLAIIRGKLELLMDEELDDRQARLILSAQGAVERLRKMGQSLLLLTKLENREFEDSGPTDISRVLGENLEAFRELIEMKSLSLEQDISPGVMVRMHAELAGILVSNLLSNAIRHNAPGGRIGVRLRAGELRITNTGVPPKGDPEDMFMRFRKNSTDGDSSGLGLAIVKQICEQCNIHISYRYDDPLHIFELVFSQ